MNPQMPIIKLAAAVITNPSQQFLLVRKKGSVYYMQAGGKIEPQETPINALIRELQEELNLLITPEQAHYLGCYQAPAANEAGHTVIAQLFHIPLPHSDFEPAAEIEEVRWATQQQAIQLQLAPLTRDSIIPIIANDIW